ncbi:MAG: hypothetical protein QW559_00715 [Candidatus Woesearchaeota archaeon]
MTFIVLLIISIVIFGSSMVVLRNIFFKAKETQTVLDEKTEQELESLISAGEIVAVLPAQKKLGIKDSAVFGIGVQNILLDEQNFYVMVGFDRAFTPDGTTEITIAEQAYINKNWLRYDKSAQKIKPNEFKTIPLFVSIEPKLSNTASTRPGIYTFNICVFNGSTIQNVDETNCWKDNNRGLLYPDKRPRRLVVEVV